jgi:cbb3-type cytochrome oxidase cytochrome c subunit
MKGFTPLVLGILATLAFSWLGLAYIPDLQIGHLDPQSDEEGTDVYPVPKSGMAERGRRVYIANGCFYCHSEQVRADYAASDIDRKWGDRRSAPRDYIFDRPALLGKMRLGPDLANIGKRAPAEEEAAPAQPSPANPANPAPANASPPAANASPPPANAQQNAKSAAQPSTPPAPNASPPAANASPPPPNAQQNAQPAAQSSTPPAPAASPPTANASPPPANAQQNAQPAAQPPSTPPAPAAPPPPANASPSPATAQQNAKPAQPPTAPAGSPAQAAAPPSPAASPSESPALYSAAWHHLHLYAPRNLNLDSDMRAYKFLYQKRRFGGEQSADAVTLRGDGAPGEGWEIVPTYDAKCLVAYLMSLNQSHPLNEVKSAAPPAVSPAAAKPAAK